MSTEPKTHSWYLEGYAVDSKSLWTFPLLEFPVRVGRRPDIGLSLLSPLISTNHAEIFIDGGALKLRDLGSTNGTFVNSVRLPAGEARELKEGDILHFASMEFRLGRLAAGDTSDSTSDRTTMLKFELPRQVIDRARRFGSLLKDGAVVCVKQAIVRLQTGETMGYELLGRGGASDLPQSPKELFEIASDLGAAAELSRLFRIVSAPLLRGMPGRPVWFFNTHPAELEKPGLVESLHELRRELPGERLALEIHEQAVTSATSIRELRSSLAELDIELAYDDFGAGRGRINELVEVPPDYLKFDESLITGIDRAPPAKRELLQALLRVCHDGKIQALAEGVETEAEAQTLRELGFDLAQGYLFGKPIPIVPAGPTNTIPLP